jgi:hypothetical protein
LGLKFRSFWVMTPPADAAFAAPNKDLKGPEHRPAEMVFAISPFRPKSAGAKNPKSSFCKNYIALSEQHLSIVTPVAISPFRPKSAGSQVIQRAQ